MLDLSSPLCWSHGHGEKVGESKGDLEFPWEENTQEEDQKEIVPPSPTTHTKKTEVWSTRCLLGIKSYEMQEG